MLVCAVQISYVDTYILSLLIVPLPVLPFQVITGH